MSIAVIPPNTATAALRRISFTLVDETDLITPEDITVTGVKVTLSIAGGTPAASTNDIVKVDGTNGEYYLELTQAESNQAAGTVIRGWLQPTGCALTKIAARIDDVMRGTDGANTTAPLDAAGIRTAVGLASANLDTQLADLPTVSEFNARSLPSDDYFVVGDYTAPPATSAIVAALDANTYHGRAFDVIMQRLGSYISGITTVTDNLDGTNTIEFKQSDGTTKSYDVTYDTGDGTRSAIS